eukprot:TRINITY_DN13323_c0_g1_i1.p1 TRINITY_DN13323_c0_g1~~TRINITY_DN13323_c0_g1_i1.p1  ORF type:complete len:865 (+),score=145.77 TRINITY_DN13323_c0_g1_i1:34-2595(+)
MRKLLSLLLLFCCAFLFCNAQSDKVFLGGKFILPISNTYASGFAEYNHQTNTFSNQAEGVFKNGIITSLLFVNNTLLIGGGFQWVNGVFSDSVASFEISTNKLHGTNPSIWRSTQSNLLEIKEDNIIISQECLLLAGSFVWKDFPQESRILCYHLTKNEWSHFPDTLPDSPVLAITASTKGSVYTLQIINGTVISRYDPVEKIWDTFHSENSLVLLPQSLAATSNDDLFAVAVRNSSNEMQYHVLHWDSDNLNSGPTELKIFESLIPCPAPLLVAYGRGEGMFVVSPVDCHASYVWEVFFYNGTQKFSRPDLNIAVTKLITTTTGSLFAAGPPIVGVEGDSLYFYDSSVRDSKWTQVVLQPITYKLGKMIVTAMTYDETYHDLYVSFLSYENDEVSHEATPRLLKWSTALKRTTEIFTPPTFQAVGEVNGMVSLSNGDILAAGDFDYAGLKSEIKNAAIWDGDEWQDNSLPSGGVAALTSVRDNVFGVQNMGTSSMCFTNDAQPQTDGSSPSTGSGLFGNASDRQLPVYKYTREKGWSFLSKSPFVVGTTSSQNRCVTAKALYGLSKSNRVFIGGNFRALLNNGTALAVLIYDIRKKTWSTLPISLRNGYIDEIERFGESSDGNILLMTGRFKFSVTHPTLGRLSYHNVARWSLEEESWLPIDSTPLDDCPETGPQRCYFSSIRPWSLTFSGNSTTHGLLAGGAFVWKSTKTSRAIRRGVLFYDSENNKWFEYGTLSPVVDSFTVDERTSTLLVGGHYASVAADSLDHLNKSHTAVLFYRWNSTISDWSDLVPHPHLSVWWVDQIKVVVVPKDDSIFRYVVISLCIASVVVSAALVAYGVYYHMRRKLSYSQV